MRARIGGGIGLLALWVSAAAAQAGGWRDHVVLTLSERARVEVVDWFGPQGEGVNADPQRYTFFASQLRAGVRVTFAHVQVVAEAQDTRLINLPDDASLAPPAGNLGPGGNYFAHTRDRDQGETFLKQGYATLRHSALSTTIGRFEYSDALETVPPDPSLAWLKRARLAERLVGPYGYTHVTRSFDGVRIVYDRPAWNVTAFGSRPTHGGFEVSANREISDTGLASLALTAKRLPNAPPLDARLFYLYYEDGRDRTVKVDNRPRDTRAADGDAIRVHSWGGHAVTVTPLGPGAVDALLWGTLQAGDWGTLDHWAWAYAIETGYQLPTVPGAPWFRLGFNRSAGDDNPADDDHRTFFQVLPTARIYAQFPFYNLMNNQDLFAQLILRPSLRATLRVDYHWLRVTEGRDLWYAGGGATNDNVFGFSGPPAGGRHQLAHLVDFGVNVALMQRVSLYVYYGHAIGGGVARQTFADADADYAYMDLIFRY